VTLRGEKKMFVFDDALDRTLWRARFGRGYGPVAIQTTPGMNFLLKRETRTTFGSVF
jgi:hypothetical protein